MARTTAKAAAPSPEKTGEAGNEQQLADQLAQDVANAQSSDAPQGNESGDQFAQDAGNSQDQGSDAAAQSEAGATVVVQDVTEAKAWTLPAIDQFPATLQITNATPCKTHIVGTEVEIEAGATDEVTFETAKAYQRFTSHAVQIAELKGWKQGEGITVGVPNGED